MFKGIIKAISMTTLLSTQTFAAAPSNPSAMQGVKDLLQYMYNISGKKILSGQESMFGDGSFPSSRDQYVNQKTNKYPAVYASDFGDVNSGNLADRKKVVANCIAYAKKGSIISIQYHMIQPDLEDGAGFAAMNIKGSTYTKMNDILTAGSSLNTVLNTRLDELAGYLKTLQDSGVTVIFRPYHEMNGDFFWWSYQPRYKDLWIYTWKYLTETKQCNNLLWMFSANYWSGNAAMANPRYYYPGDQYVDMLGVDVYTNYGHSYAKSCHDSLRALGNARPIAITENGTLPSNFAAWRSEQPYWVYFLTWWGFEGDDKGNTQAVYDEVYGHSSVITQDEIKSVDTTEKMVSVSVTGLGKVTPNPATSTVAKGTSVTFTPAADAGWKFDSWSGAATGNTNPLTLTANTDIVLVAKFVPLEGTAVNLLKNGDFSQGATIGWSQIAGYEGGAATASVVDGELAIKITSGGSLIWHVQLTQNDVKLEKGKTYKLTFKVHADQNRKFMSKVGENGGAYTPYFINDTLTTTTTATVREFTFKMDTTDNGARVEFNIGLSTVGMYLDDVGIYEIDPLPVKHVYSVNTVSDALYTHIRSGNLEYRLESGNSGAVDISLYSVDGSRVANSKKPSGVINCSRFATGVYTLCVKNGGSVINRSIILH